MNIYKRHRFPPDIIAYAACGLGRSNDPPPSQPWSHVAAPGEGASGAHHLLHFLRRNFAPYVPHHGIEETIELLLVLELPTR